MNLLRALALSFAVAAAGCTTTDPDTTFVPNPADVLGTLGAVESFDPALAELVPTMARLEIIAEGFDWSEGPVWVDEDGGYLLFSDIPPNRVHRWKSGEGVSVYLPQSGYLDALPRPNHIAPDEPGSNGLVLDPYGNLVLCQHGLRQVARMNAPLSAPRAEYVPLATHWDGKRLNSPNDAAFRKNGDLYFTDPPYGLTRKMQDPEKEIDFQGVYRRTPDGAVTLLTREMSRPNGLAFSPDEKTLYVANSDPKRAVWMAFPVQEDGTLGEGRVHFDATPMVGERPGLPDGLAVDERGNLFATGPGGVLVLTPDGRHLGTLLTGRPTSNCTFGDDGRTLYITADGELVRVRLHARGVRRSR
ncbi:MAG: SMP-30/gluconolactonase/LRE family protein [Planctomycetota bacterium]|nr:SMP-30/gluconolactonase/LRE family protein [Planctomycetota bacterium]